MCENLAYFFTINQMYPFVLVSEDMGTFTSTSDHVYQQTPNGTQV